MCGNVWLPGFLRSCIIQKDWWQRVGLLFKFFWNSNTYEIVISKIDKYISSYACNLALGMMSWIKWAEAINSDDRMLWILSAFISSSIKYRDKMMSCWPHEIALRIKLDGECVVWFIIVGQWYKCKLP